MPYNLTTEILVLAGIGALILVAPTRRPPHQDQTEESAHDSPDDSPPDIAALPVAVTPPSRPPPPAAPATTIPPPAQHARASASHESDQKRLAAVQTAFQRLTPAEATLYSDFERTGATAPPETATLLDRYRAGGTRADLESFVRQSFPRDAAVRLAAMAWIARVHPQRETESASSAQAEETLRAHRAGHLERRSPPSR